MNTTTRIALITSFHTATNRKGLIAWLKGANAYTGHSRDGMVELVAHSQAVCTQLVEDEAASKVAEQAAMQVAAAEAIAIQDAKVAPQSEEDALAEAEALFAQAEATKAKPAPKAKGPRKVSDKQAAVQASLDGLAGKGPSATVTRAEYVAAYGEQRTHNARAFTAGGWLLGSADGTERPARHNSVLRCALRVGIAISWDAAAPDVLQMRRLDTGAADAQRATFSQGMAAYEGAKAARTELRNEARTARPVSAKQVAGITAAVAAAEPTADGTVVLTAVDLAIAGLGKGWTKVARKQLADPTHVKARTLAAAGYIGACMQGTLVLTAMAADEAKAAS